VSQSNTTSSTSIATTTSTVLQSITQTVTQVLESPDWPQWPTVPGSPVGGLPNIVQLPPIVVPAPVVVLPPLTIGTLHGPVGGQAPAEPTPIETAASEASDDDESNAFAAEPSDGIGPIPPGAAAGRPDSRSARPARRPDGGRPGAAATGAPVPGVVFVPIAAAAAPTLGDQATAGSARGGTAAGGRPATRSSREHAPLPRPPFAPATNISVASTAPGSGSSGTGVAILIGALLLAAPYAARWLRVAAGTRPRAPFLRRPERPG
jgi:hypothetical protein